MSIAAQCTVHRSPNKFWRSDSMFNLWFYTWLYISVGCTQCTLYCKTSWHTQFQKHFFVQHSHLEEKQDKNEKSLLMDVPAWFVKLLLTTFFSRNLNFFHFWYSVSCDPSPFCFLVLFLFKFFSLLLFIFLFF
jgi:hypothetical protein